MDWITYTDSTGATKGNCIKCRSDKQSCSMCGGEYDSTTLTCNNK